MSIKIAPLNHFSPIPFNILQKQSILILFQIIPYVQLLLLLLLQNCEHQIQKLQLIIVTLMV